MKVKLLKKEKPRNCGQKRIQVSQNLINSKFNPATNINIVPAIKTEVSSLSLSNGWHWSNLTVPEGLKDYIQSYPLFKFGDAPFDTGKVQFKRIDLRENPNFDKAMYYIGEVDENDVAHGRGIMLFENKSKCEGWYLHGQITKGRKVYTNGNLYQGEFKYFLEDGEGTLSMLKKKSTYTGSFKEGKFHGQGRIDLQDGSYYESIFVKGHRRNKDGVLTEVDGKKYSGSFLKDKKHGTGVLVYPNGDREEG